MSEKDSRTEQASAYKLRKAREKGQIARSKDVGPAITLFLLVLGLLFNGSAFVHSIQSILNDCLTGAFNHGGQKIPLELVGHSFTTTIFHLILPFLGLLALLGLLGSYLQGGFVLSGEPLAMDLTKLSPGKGFKKLLSLGSLVQTLKSVLILIILSWIAWTTIKHMLPTLPTLVGAPVPAIVSLWTDSILSIAFRFSIFIVILAVGDFAYQKFKFKQDMKMSKEEQRDEHKTIEGNPLIKSRIRKQMFSRAMQRMIQSIPEATAVVTNPTHYAVAIKYDPDTMNAPIVVAKGQDRIAQRIKEVAAEHDIPIIENKPLAQALYKQAEIGAVIPSMLFRAVAELLAYLYRTGKWKQNLAYQK